MRHEKLIYSFVSACLLLGACSMDESPKSEIDKESIFNNEKGLQTYSYSFYDILPSISNGYKKDAMCDYGAVTSFDSFLRDGAYSAEVATGWSSDDWKTYVI